MDFRGKNVFEEASDIGNPHRKNYVEGIKSFVERNNQEAKARRRSFLAPKKLVADPDFYREKLIKMLGINNILKENCPSPIIQFVGEDELCRIYRLTVYITCDIPFYGMLLVPHGEDSHPLVVCQHGGSRTPELLCGFNGENSYGFAAQRLLKLGAAVLAPQLLLWSLAEIPTARDYKVGYDRKEIDTNLRRFGITLTGLEVTGIMRLIDFAVTQPRVTSDKIGMAGLSYGGYYTIYTMAVDTRIKAGFSAGCFNDRGRYPWSDTTYFDSGNTFEDAEIAALCAPRPLYIAVGREDGVFNYQTALPEVDRVYEYFKVYGKPDNLKFELWDGGHRFPETDNGFEFLMKGIEDK